MWYEELLERLRGGQEGSALYTVSFQKKQDTFTCSCQEQEGWKHVLQYE